jgi:hypothetical protein
MNIKNRSSKITAELDIPAGSANGAILCQGGRFGGWSLYMKDGKPAYTYNFLGARIEKTHPNVFSADETADVGMDNQTPVAEGIGIGPDTRFTGRIDTITLEVR